MISIEQIGLHVRRGLRKKEMYLIVIFVGIMLTLMMTLLFRTDEMFIPKSFTLTEIGEAIRTENKFQINAVMMLLFCVMMIAAYTLENISTIKNAAGMRMRCSPVKTTYLIINNYIANFILTFGVCIVLVLFDIILFGLTLPIHQVPTLLLALTLLSLLSISSATFAAGITKDKKTGETYISVITLLLMYTSDLFFKIGDITKFNPLYQINELMNSAFYGTPSHSVVMAITVSLTCSVLLMFIGIGGLYKMTNKATSIQKGGKS